MAKLVGAVILLALLLLAEFSLALSLEYVTETSLSSSLKFQKTQIGGLSGIFYQNKSLWAVSDDRGKFAEPRLYKFSFNIEKNKVELKPTEVVFIKDLPGDQRSLPFLDLEGLALLSDGTFILSSEGDNNKKPRQMPLLFEVHSKGQWKKDIKVADDFLPEKTGLQTKGIQNNSGFEGLSISPSGKTLFVAAEAPLLQDVASDQKKPGRFIRVVQYQKPEDSQTWQETAQYAYRLEDLSPSDEGPEVFRGISEILAISDEQLLVLERGVRLFGKGLYNLTAALYTADLKGATAIKPPLQVSSEGMISLKKIKVLDFEKDLKKHRAEKKVQNFEALSWGPSLPDGRKTILVLSDNNFSKKEITELLVFAVKEK